MSRAIAGLLLFAAACNAQLGHSLVDAGPGGANGDARGGASDAPNNIAADASIDAAPACSNGRVVYLNFEGQTITQAATSDATQNQASWIGVATANVPPYHQTSTNRNGQISNIVSGVQGILSQFPITVVTTRPAAGPYVMIVFGGTNQTVGSNYTYATSYHDCGDLVKSDVGWVSDTVPNGIVANTAVGTIGWSLGLQGTSDSNDCMCAWASTCTPNTTPCTLGTNETTGTSKTPATTCPGLNPQDEQAAFRTAFCQ